MAGSVSEEPGFERYLEGISSEQFCQIGETLLAEFRSSEQVENGTPSTSPPYWDTDDEDDCGPKPSELYGKYTWKIDKFSQVNKRELRSNAFEVGGYKWYILIYPQGCDVCNHLSLFLCVANHDKLLPGWSHFAQFTIAVVNKDPKKSKYSDTLHRFWKKEHDWGWKKFMELSKVLDGFIDADTLIIKAQVQVIRERADRPFHCLDCQYRRELVRVYLTNVEQICRRFVEERRGKLGKLLEDKARWSSFCAFWLGMDQNARRRMSREKTDSILKVVVKHFFVEKEVTSTLVMDSLYSGLKALEGQTKNKKGRGKYLDAEELPVPIVRTEKDMFVLVDDVLLLLERAALEPLPPKDEKGPQNRIKDGGSGEDFNKDSIERDERRLTELGRRTIEIFVLAHIFSSKIEVAYQEAVAFKRQEELIREEEAAWLVESEQNAKRGAAEKEKKSKKKQGKQKRNNRKGKDKGRDEKPGVMVHDKAEEESLADERKDLSTEEAEPVLEKPDVLEDFSDLSDSVDCAPEILQLGSEDRDASPVNWDTDTLEVHPPSEASSSRISGLSAVQNGIGGKKSPSVIDDSSSTCSTDSVPSVVMNGPSKGNSAPNQKSLKSPSRGRNQRVKAPCDLTRWANELRSQPFEAASEVAQVQPNDVFAHCKAAESESQAVGFSLQDRTKWLKVTRKEEATLQRKLSVKDESLIERPSTEKTRRVASPPSSPPENLTSAVQTRVASLPSSPPENLTFAFQTRRVASPPSSPPENLTSAVQPKSELKVSAVTDPVSIRKPSSDSSKQIATTDPLVSSTEIMVTSRPDAHKIASPKPTEKSMAQQAPVTTEKPTVQRAVVTAEKHIAQRAVVTTEKPTLQQLPVMSRPLSAPLVPGPRPAAPVISMVQTAPLLPRSASAAGRLGPDPSSATHSYVPQSYRNAMMGNHVPATSANFSQPHSPSSALNSLHSYPQPSATLISSPMLLPHSSERMEPNSIKSSFSFGMVNHDALQNGPQWMDCPRRDSSRSIHCDPSSLHNDIRNFDLYNPVHGRPQDRFSTEFPAGTSGRQNHDAMVDEFPHLDIINDLLDDEQGMGQAGRASSSFQCISNGPHQLNRQFTFPSDMGMSNDVDPSSSSCRFERTRSYHDDGFKRGYVSSGSHFDPLRDMSSQASSRPYANPQVDGLFSNQWQMTGSSDLPFLSMRNTEGESYPYHIPEYSNMTCNVNGYTVFRPSNGH